MSAAILIHHFTIKEFTRRIEPVDWEKFYRYAKRVKILNLSPSSEDLSERERPLKFLSFSVLVELAISRPKMHFLPRLTDLTLWTERSAPYWIHFTTLLLCDNLRCLSLTMPVYDGPTLLNVEVFLKEIPVRSPSLTSISLDFAPLGVIYKHDILELLGHLVLLNELILSRCVWFQEVVSVVACLPKLRRLTIETRSRYGEGTVVLPEPGQINVDDAFPSLEYLEIHGSLHGVMGFVCSNFNATKLEELRVDVTGSNDAIVLEALFCRLSKTSPNLRTMAFTRSWSRGANEGLFNSHSEPITLQTLQPLPSFRNLACLILLSYWPISITHEDEVVDLISQCPALTSLDLNCEPFSGRPSTFTIGIVGKLCRARPTLQKLCVYVDASDVQAVPLATSRCDNLRSLSFGFSKITNARDVALYLSDLLTPCCVLDLRIKCSGDTFADVQMYASLEHLSVYHASWDMVQFLLPSLIRARIADREVIDALQTKILELELRLSSATSDSQKEVLDEDCR